MNIQQAIEKARVIEIISGEGEMGNVHIFYGKRTERALKIRITKERCGGRFCYAKIDGEKLYLTDDGLTF